MRNPKNETTSPPPDPGAPGAKLSRRQQQVITDLFESDLDEARVLARHGVSANLFRRWLAQPQFRRQLAGRIESARRQSEIIIARFAPVAAARLVELAASGKDETARRACLDIISLPSAGSQTGFTPDKSSLAQPDKTGPDTPDAPGGTAKLSPETASRLLAALAEEQNNNSNPAELDLLKPQAEDLL
jgi:transposase-like protein